jgi:hypothetical protein
MHRGILSDGGKAIQHRAVDIAVADGVGVLLEANQKRIRALMFNASALGTGSTVYVGDATDVDGNDLAAANGWPLNEIVEAGGGGWKLAANVLETFTQAAIYGLAAGADATVKIYEELVD